MNFGGFYNPVNYPNPMSYQQSCLKGRIVSSPEEVRSVLIDMDGSTAFFPCPSNNLIYTKTIDLNGNAVIRAYKMIDQPVMANNDNNLEARISQLENAVKGLINNVQSKPNEQSTSTDVRKQS